MLVTTEYFFYPLLSGFYLIFEPKRSLAIRILNLALWISGLTLMDVMLEKYTNLIEYVHYSWYLTWINFFCIFAITNLIYQWFFKDKAHFQVEKEAVK
ncbi:CBO0543 family protein [Bacillus sp. 1P10SD]|uniref:CBO0543 family protein n=1 Tax=Bacillus sp. 1P10SD TaxID=3132265 RepID=UPI0039A73550